MNVLGVIPARLSSTRLPRKVLREIAGVPMVVHVFIGRGRARSERRARGDRRRRGGGASAARITIPAVMTSADHPSGTDRLWEVVAGARGRRLRQHPGRRAARDLRPHRDAGPPVPERARGPGDHAQDPRHGRGGGEPERRTRWSPTPTATRSTSRAPHSLRSRQGAASRYWKHIGLYAYRRPVLEAFHRLPPSSLEQAEKLEQLRLLEKGIPIRVLETDRAHGGRGHRGGSSRRGLLAAAAAHRGRSPGSGGGTMAPGCLPSGKEE